MKTLKMDKINNLSFFINKFKTCNNVNIVDAYLPVFRLDIEKFEGVEHFAKSKEYRFKDCTYIVFIHNNTLYLFKSKNNEYNGVAQSSNIIFKTSLDDAYKYVDIHLLLPELYSLLFDTLVGSLQGYIIKRY